MSSQQLMYKDIEGLGKVSYSDKEMSEKLNISEHLVSKYNKSLKDKGLLYMVDSDKFENGTMIPNKIFDLSKLQQDIIFFIICGLWFGS
jgi:Mn-dependent DtxR family transcriptional regulator